MGCSCALVNRPFILVDAIEIPLILPALEKQVTQGHSYASNHAMPGQPKYRTLHAEILCWLCEEKA